MTDKKWRGFQLTGYYLVGVPNLPIIENCIVNGKREEIPTTIGEIYKSVAKTHFEVEDVTVEIVVRTDTEERRFGGKDFNMKMLYEMLRLRQEGDGPLGARWYWYDRNWGDDGTRYDSFFVQFQDKIVRESVVVIDAGDSGFDSSVFEATDSSNPWTEATRRFWYRKFYTETKTGQLMVLRDDNPRLYGYSRDSGFVAGLRHIRTLLWILIGITALILIRLWN